MGTFTPHRPGRRDWLAALAVALATAAAYARTVGFDFVNFDDSLYAYANPNVLGGLTPDALWWAATTIEGANWHPLTWASLQLDATLWGADPAGYHLTNLILHALNAALVYLVFFAATGAAGRSLALAAVWGLHPLHVESVAWVSERKDVLCAFFWLLAMAAHVRYAAAPSWRRSLPVAACCALALLAKPMAVTLPCALVLFDFWPLGRLRGRADFERLLREKWLLFALIAASCAATFCAQSFGGAVRGMNEVSLPQRLANVVDSYTAYLRQTAWPSGLIVFYQLPNEPPPAWETALESLALLAVTALAVARRRRAPYLLFGWLWFLGTLVPVIGLVHVGEQAHADRYTYLPHVGLFAALAWGAADLAARLRVPVPARWALAAALVAALAVLTWRQVGHWRNGVALWQHARDVDPHSTAARVNLARAYLGRGENERALQLLDEALAEDPHDFQAWQVKAVVLRKLGRWHGHEILPPQPK